MPRPQFTADEEYLIKAALSPTVNSQANSYMWGYVLGGAGLAAFATYSQSFVLLLSAFVVVCGFRIYEEHSNAKWLPLWRSILDKYEAAILEAPNTRSEH